MLIVVLAEVMKRIAASCWGGIVTSFVLELLVYPVLYAVCREKFLKDQDTTRETLPTVEEARLLQVVS
jgi:hypothetical protein